MRSVLHAVVLAAGLGTTLPGCLKPPSELPQLPNEGPPAPPATAGEVLSRYIAAAGGVERLRAIDNRGIDAMMVFHAQEDCDPEAGSCLAEDQKGTFHLISTADGRLYRRTILVDVVEEMGFDGKTGWELRAGAQLSIQNEDESAASREDAVLHWYFDLKKRGISVTLERPRTQDTQGQAMTLDGIRWETRIPNSVPKTMWFDRATGLLHEEVVEDAADSSAQAPQQRQLLVYTDYREVDGVMVPFAIEVTTQIDEAVQRLSIITQRVDHGGLDATDTEFEIPEVPDPDPRPDTVIASLASARAAAEAAPKEVAAQTEHMRMAFAAANFQEAAKAAQTVLRMEPKEPEALLVRARLHLIGGKSKAASKALGRAKAAGIKDEVVAREEAWLHYRAGNYAKLATALDRAGMPVLAGRFRSFVGKPANIVSAGECVTTLPMVTTYPLVTVEIEVLGTKVPAIVDTGAGHLVLSESLAAELGVSVRPLGGSTKGPIMGHGQVKSLKLGDVTLSNVPTEVFRDEEMARNAGDVGEGVRAAFGLGMLTQFLISIDTPGKTVQLVGGRRGCEQALAARRKGPSAPFWRAELNYLYVKAEVDGAEGVYLLNTGIRGADMAATQAAYAHAGIGAPAIHSDQTPIVEIDEITIGPGFVARKAIGAYGFFEQTQTNDGYRLDGMLGLGVLGQAPVVFDFNKRRLYFPPIATASASAK